MAARKKSGPRKKTTRKKYGPTARKDVSRALHELELGELESGRSKRKVRSRKQAIAIGLSEARRSGEAVPPPKRSAPKKRAEEVLAEGEVNRPRGRDDQIRVRGAWEIDERRK